MKLKVFIVCALRIDILAFILHLYFAFIFHFASIFEFKILQKINVQGSRIRKLTSYLKKSNTTGDNAVV